MMIVEDDPMVMQIHSNYLAKAGGFTVAARVSDGEEALAALKKEQVDLIILDVFMPKADGFAVLQRIREEGYDTVVIMVTAANDYASLNRAMKLGALDYLIKPYDYSRLEKALKKFRRKMNRKEGGQKAVLLEQREVDLFFEESEREDDLPKSINPNTIELVRRFFREHGREEYTSLEVAQAVELSSVTARKYLNYLISQQELKATVDYMTGGRPCIRYRYVSRSLGDRKRRSACPVK